MSVTFTQQGAAKIQKVVRRVLNTPEQRNAERAPTAPTETQFWALITGSDVTGLRHTFIRVVPVTTRDRADFAIGRDKALMYEIAGERPEEGWAREANGNRGIPFYSVVRVEFVGYDSEGLPSFLFNYGDARDEQAMRPHDHRDMWNGGFAFACYHPGTGLPQQPWAT